jgi:hypothetical protein
MTHPREDLAAELSLRRDARMGQDQELMATDPPVSEPQRKAMYAAAAGHSTLGIPKNVGEEFVGKAHDARMFPSYTLAELKADLGKTTLSPETRAKMQQEIAARESGASQVKVTPQVAPAAKGATPFAITGSRRPSRPEPFW